MRKVDISIPRKKGPFFIRKLRLHETMEIMAGAQAWGSEQTHLKLVQACLCRQDGKPVYQDTQMEKMEDDLGGVLIIKLGMDAQEENNFSELGQFAGKVETAGKN